MGEKRKKVEELEQEMQKADFWTDKERAVAVTHEITDLKEKIKKFNNLKQELEDLHLLFREGESQGLMEELGKLEKKIKKEEIEVFLSEKYDKNSAVLQILAGAGGQDSQDWVTLLLRMYERYCQKKGWKVKILHQSFGEGGGPEGRIGTKSVTMEMEGPFAFGFLKKEAGVHRLVRISPFSPKKLPHTYFSQVEVLHEIEKKEYDEIKIKNEDLRIDFYRASGPGGQYVNKRETAVRITHLPTGIVVSCQSERLQGQNRERAMKILYTKLQVFKEEEKKKELNRMKGKKVSASWGSQIRSYVLHPYRLVKDLRTNLETSDVNGVLDGNLDEFIEAEIKI